MEGLVAVLGFWIFMIAMVGRKPFIAYIERCKIQNADVVALNNRVQQLETMLSNVNREMLESKETTDFTHKLVTTTKK